MDAAGRADRHYLRPSWALTPRISKSDVQTSAYDLQHGGLLWR